MFGNALQYARKECTIHDMMRHDNVVKLHKYTENEESIVMFMEYCNAADYFVDKLVEPPVEPIMNQEKLALYAMDTLEGLNYVHKNGIIHSDMKQANLLVQKPT